MPENEQPFEAEQPHYLLGELTSAEVLRRVVYGAATIAVVYGGWKTGLWPTVGPNP